MAIKTAVVDDHSLFREGVISALASSPVINVVGEGGSAAEAIDIAERLSPDILLLDLSLPGGGIEAAREIGLRNPEVKVVILTVSEVGDDVISAFDSGVRGYLLKGVSAAELIHHLEAAHRGEMVISPSLGARLVARMGFEARSGAGRDAGLSSLTSRQLEILELASQGLTNKEIGRRLSLSELTVRNHMTTILHRLNARNRVEAARVLAAKRSK